MLLYKFTIFVATNAIIMKINLSKLTVLLVLCLIHLNLTAQNYSRSQYINKYKDIAVRQMNAYGIPASIILAQACLESGNGNSRLAVKGNNHFGIKCHNGWKGKKIYKTDDKFGDCFRKYISAEESFKDHSEFLKNGRRYQSLFSLSQTDYKAWARGLKAAGYATNPKYAQLLIDIIEKNNLTQYDNDGTKASKKAARKRLKEERKAKKLQQNQNVQGTGAAVAGATTAIIASTTNSGSVAGLTPLKNSRFYTAALSRPLYKINGVTMHITNKGDSYAQIAKDYKLFKRELLKFNDINVKGDVLLSEGDIVYLEKKKRKNKKGSYRANEGESLYMISQLTGVRLSSLKALNNINENKELQQGTIIKLK